MDGYGVRDMITKEQREKMINELVKWEEEINFSDKSFREDVILGGWVGYNNMPDEEIERIYYETIQSEPV